MKKIRLIWIIIFIIGFGVRFSEILHPADTLSWRENDVLSIARNYYRNGMDFIKPQIDWRGTGPGYTESEFPIYPYLIAISYKFFGIWEPIGRIISFLFSMGSLFFFSKLSKYLFNEKTAIAVASFFALSPLLMLLSISIQPESSMFFFYILSAYSFFLWLDSQSKKDYFFTAFSTALAILCKLTAINIGIFFVLSILSLKGRRFLFKPKVIILGILSILPSIIWYTYSHKLYLQFGNSLGISNEYAWIGWDFFTESIFIKGIIESEIFHVWTLSGPLIILMALFATKMIKKPVIIIPVCWLSAAFLFYVISSRLTSDSWAFYYHIFSIPSVSMLLGISVIELYDKFFPLIKLTEKSTLPSSVIFKGRIVIMALFILISSYSFLSVRYLFHTKRSTFKTSEYYECKDNLSNSIPEQSLILASGRFRLDGIYPLAFNSSYFFYWLDRKGYNISIEDQSIENVLSFKEKGSEYYIAEKDALILAPGFEEKLRKRFKSVLECNGIILFKL